MFHCDRMLLANLNSPISNYAVGNHERIVRWHKYSIDRDQFLAVEFWHVNNSGLCASHLVILLSRWLLRHDTLCIWKSKTKNILDHNWYDVLDKKTLINFNVMIKLSKHSLKISLHTDFGGGGGGLFTKLKQWKALYRGQKSIVPCYDI